MTLIETMHSLLTCLTRAGRKIPKKPMHRCMHCFNGVYVFSHLFHLAFCPAVTGQLAITIPHRNDQANGEYHAEIIRGHLIGLETLLNRLPWSELSESTELNPSFKETTFGCTVHLSWQLKRENQFPPSPQVGVSPGRVLNRDSNYLEFEAWLKAWQAQPVKGFVFTKAQRRSKWVFTLFA